jgi:putative endonuclease
MFYTYILYSESLDRYYIGSTSLAPEDRLDNHLSKYYSAAKFTAKANDWVIFLAISCSSFNQARKIESHIKKMKSKRFIANLKKYPDLVQKLIHSYPDS